MRSTGIGLCCVFLALLLLFSGLVLAEKGLLELLGLQRKPGAFRFGRAPSGEPFLVFAGRTVIFDPAGWMGRIRTWWAESRYFFGGTNLDKAAPE